MVLVGSTQRIVTGLTFFFPRGRPCLCVAGASVGAACGVRAANHLAAGSFLHASHRNVLSSSSGRMRRLQDLQGDVRPFLLPVVCLRRGVPMLRFSQNPCRLRVGQAGRWLSNAPLHPHKVWAWDGTGKSA